jgi:hypothetical protein
VICGAEDWVAVEDIGKAKHEWLKGFLELPNGIPSHDWVLDIAFHEDDCRVRKDHEAQNLAILRHIALNLLKRERTSKVGVKNKRLKAGWDQRYLRKVLDVKPN